MCRHARDVCFNILKLPSPDTNPLIQFSSGIIDSGTIGRTDETVKGKASFSVS